MGRKKRTVAVVASEHNEHARHVVDAVERHGGRALLVDTDRVPDDHALSWLDDEVSYRGQRLDDVRCFYVKAISLSLPLADPAHVGERDFAGFIDRYTAERERHSFISSVLRALATPDRVFVNPVTSFDLHLLKVHQLSLLRRLGVPVPATLATSDGNAVRAFAATHGQVIYKPLSGGAETVRLQERDLTDDRLALLRGCPALFQEEIIGPEFRAYLLDDDPLGAFRIPTRGVVDARRNLHRAKPARLPEAAWDLVRRAARGLGLLFTAADLRRDRRGRFVVLELNPTPAISFYEDPVHGRIIQSLASYLVDKA